MPQLTEFCPKPHPMGGVEGVIVYKDKVIPKAKLGRFTSQTGSLLRYLPLPVL